MLCGTSLFFFAPRLKKNDRIPFSEKTLLAVLKSRNPVASPQQMIDVLSEEARLYGRGRRFRHQLGALNQLLGLVDAQKNPIARAKYATTAFSSFSFSRD